MNRVDEASVLIETPPSASTFAQTKSQKVGAAYLRYCEKYDAGEKVDANEFCARYPSFQSSLGRLLHAHHFLEENPNLLSEERGIRWPVAGETFLDFDLVLALGQGAFARVFLAREAPLGNRLVVVKIAKQGGAAEAKILGRIQHPNVVPIHSIQTPPDLALTLVCMPYLGTATLHDVFDLLKVAT